MDKSSDWLFSFSSSFMKNHQNKPHSGNTICITSGKGGVGKTSLAIMMAKELAKKNKKVLLIDTDFNLSNTAVKLNLRTDKNFLQLLKGNISFEQCLLHYSGFDLLPACNGDLELFKENYSLEEFFIDLIATHRSEYDYVLLDSPAGVGKTNMILSAYCDERIILVTPDKSSVTDAYSLMKILSQNFAVKNHQILINASNGQKQADLCFTSLSETLEHFLNVRVSFMGTLPFCRKGYQYFDQRYLIEDQSYITKPLKKLVESFLKNIEQRPLNHGQTGCQA